MSLSTAELLASQPEEEWKEILASLTDAQTEGLVWDWKFWGRPEQKEPQGDWLTWLILAGRGFGKTRTGAETIRDWACGKTPLAKGRYRRFLLIAETAADARDVMVEGESGILSVHPKDFRPLYEPSKRRITWPNGAVASLFNATEPDQLRGPQGDAAWCLTGDALVSMADGSNRRLDRIKVGDRVITRSGPNTVIGHALTSRNTEIYSLRTVGGQTISGTANHPVWVDGRGFIPLASIQAGMVACVISVSLGEGRSGTATMAATTKRPSGYIAKFGKRNTALFPLAITSTTRAVTRAITRSKIWNCFRPANTALCITKLSSPTAKRLSPTLWLRKSGSGPSVASAIWSAVSVARYSTAVQSILRSIAQAPALSRPALVPSLAIIGDVHSAAPNTGQNGGHSFTALGGVTTAPMPLGHRHWSRALSLAHRAIERLRPAASTRGSAQGSVPCTSMATIASVERLARRADVYDIAVERGREFFANGILVHNCDELAKWQYARDTWDMLQFGLRLGDRPRQIVTTTPRPVPVVKELLAASTTVVTRGATMDNRGNLAASFLKQITARYAGTRLGRQELDAEVLDDNPSALWTRAMLEDATIKKSEMPRLARIAVAIDPSGTKGNDEGDDIGIVAAGKGNDGRMYVLADKTCQKGPAGWGKEAVDLYTDLAADVIVGERNFGGAMVEHVIRTVDDTVPFKEVTASRGKWVRAEPVSSLYEREMVKHVGSFPELEDEMCAFGPDGLADGKSPNRMDALVWVATELMLGDVGTAGIEETDWQDWKAPAFPSCAYVLAVVSPGYMGGDAGDPPALTIWGVFHDDRGNPKVMLFYSWKGHVSGPDLAVALEVLCSRNEKATIELKRIAKVLGLKAAPRFQVDRVILKSDGKADAVHRELVKVLANVSFSIEAVDPDRWGDDAARMYAVQHMFVDGMVFAPMSRVFARSVVDNVAEFPNGAHQGLANSTALALLYLRDTGLLLRAEEHSRNETEMGMHRGRERALYAG